MSDQQESLEVYTNTIISSLQEQMTIASNLSDSTSQPPILSNLKPPDTMTTSYVPPEEVSRKNRRTN